MLTAVLMILCMVGTFVMFAISSLSRKNRPTMEGYVE